MVARKVRRCFMVLVSALLAGNACIKHAAPPPAPQPGAQPAPYGASTTLQRDYPNLAGLPRLSDLIPSDERWGNPPRNPESPQVRPLLPYRGWCRYETWDTQLALASPDMLLASMGSHMTAIDAATGAILWQDDNTDYGHSETFVTDGLVVDQWGNYATEVNSGRRVKASGKIAHYPDRPLPKIDAGWVYAQQHRAEYDEDPPPPAELAFIAGSGLTLTGSCRVGQRLYAAAKRNNDDFRETYGAGIVYVVFAFDLTPSGALIPGKLKLVYPADNTSAVAQFYASADPLHDDKLMRQLVAGGAPAFDALLERITAAKPLQVLALIALCQAARPTITKYYDHPPWPAADKLLAKLKKQPSAALAPPLAVWLDTGGDPLVAQDIACLLARCGGPVAKDALLRAYDAMTYVRRTPSGPPYHPAKPNVEGGSTDDWMYLQAQGGAEYIAFTDSALASWRDVYLAIDAQGDDKYEEVLYTGLGNAFYAQCFPLGRDGLEEAKGPLKLEEQHGKLVIRHHEPRIKWETANWDGGEYKYGEITSATYISSAIDLAPLSVDSDNDGLPDNVDGAMLLDPRNADTDGDSLPDGADALPNIDQRRLGVLERGVQRAIILNTMMANPGVEPPSRTPWDATYYYVKGCGAVAVSQAPHGSGIYIHDAAEMQRYQRLLRGSNDFSTIHITVLDLLHPADPAATAGHSSLTPEQYKSLNNAPPGAAYVVRLDFAGSGDYVFLVEIDGELFPAEMGGSWIS